MARAAVVALCAAAAAAACAASTGRTGSADGPPPGAAGAVFVRDVAPFAVRNEHGDPYRHPFLGGFDVPRPQFIDIDADGDLDLFVQERSNELIFLENTGSPGAPDFVWRTDHFRDLEIGEWNRFADLDGDGDYDLLAEEPYSYIRYYRNDGSARRASFELAADSLRDAAGDPIFADRQNIPNITDIDCDGLLDLFLGRVDGTITRYEQTIRGPGAPSRFAFVTDRFEAIQIIGQIGQVGWAERAGELDRNASPGSRPTLHGANSMGFGDVDGDGDQDLLWGDFFEPGVLLIPNTGSCAGPSLRSEPVPIPRQDPLSSSGYNVPVPADIDADGDLDLFVGVLGGAFNPSITASDNFWYFERTGAGLTLRTRRFLGGIDVGSESAPALGDLDGDGDLDMIVGNKLDPDALEAARLYLFRNEGAADAPEMQLVDTLDLAPSYHYAPALADLDSDGDLDMLLGTWNDGVLVYGNEGTPREPTFVADTAATIRLTRGSHSTPALGDLDGDGDLDLVVGEASGALNFYRNVGTEQVPEFVLVSDELGGIAVGRRSHPALADLDGDGRPELIVGREAAGVAVFRTAGAGPDGAPAFAPDASFALPLPHLAAPVFADIDGDGDADVLSGGLSGGIVFFELRRGGA